MNTSSIKILKELVEGTSDTDRLIESLGVKHWQFNEHIKNLTKNEYVVKNGTMISLQKNAKTSLFVEISKKLDIEKLLHESNELIFHYFQNPSR